MTDLLTHLLAEERVREIRKHQRELDKHRAWPTRPTRPTFPRHFQRR